MSNNAVTISVAVASGVQALAAGFTYWLMRQTARQQLRAYVGYTFTGFTAQHPGRTLGFSMRIENFGQTPAERLCVRSMNFAVLRFPLRDQTVLEALDVEDPDPHEPGVMTLHCRGHVEVTSSRFLRRLSDAEIASANQPVPPEGQGAHPPVLYCFGTYDYFDAFGDQHWVRFCGIYTGDLTVDRRAKAVLAPVYNEVGRGAPMVRERPSRFGDLTD
jgi:hypothetical protein